MKPATNPEVITTRNGLLYRGNDTECIPLPEADTVAEAHGHRSAEAFVRALEAKASEPKVTSEMEPPCELCLDVGTIQLTGHRRRSPCPECRPAEHALAE